MLEHLIISNHIDLQLLHQHVFINALWGRVGEANLQNFAIVMDGANTFVLCKSISFEDKLLAFESQYTSSIHACVHATWWPSLPGIRGFSLGAVHLLPCPG